VCRTLTTEGGRGASLKDNADALGPVKCATLYLGSAYKTPKEGQQTRTLRSPNALNMNGKGGNGSKSEPRRSQEWGGRDTGKKTGDTGRSKPADLSALLTLTMRGRARFEKKE